MAPGHMQALDPGLARAVHSCQRLCSASVRSVSSVTGRTKCECRRADRLCSFGMRVCVLPVQCYYLLYTAVTRYSRHKCNRQHTEASTCTPTNRAIRLQATCTIRKTKNALHQAASDATTLLGGLTVHGLQGHQQLQAVARGNERAQQQLQARGQAARLQQRLRARASARDRARLADARPAPCAPCTAHAARSSGAARLRSSLGIP